MIFDDFGGFDMPNQDDFGIDYGSDDIMGNTDICNTSDWVNDSVGCNEYNLDNYSYPGSQTGTTCLGGIDDGANISFTGAVHTEPIANQQLGPTCAGEALANIIELSSGTVNPNLCSQLSIEALQQYGAGLLGGCAVIDPHYYQIALQNHGIGSDWMPFDHSQLQHALDANQGVLGIGDAHYLDSMTYPDVNSRHAFVITNYETDAFGNVTYYGIDSNFGGTTVKWTSDQLEKTCNASGFQESLLITRNEMRWPYK